MNNYIIYAWLLIFVFVWTNHNTEARNKTPQKYSIYSWYLDLYRQQHKQKKIKWPKTPGRCQVIPDWKINGTNPVVEESAKGNTVLLFLVRRSCDYCLSQLEYLNELAKYHRVTQQKISIVVLNRRGQPLPPAVYKTSPHIHIYEEPVDQDIFKLLHGKYKHVLIYDRCGRQQYHYGWPYSWFGNSIVRSAITNTVSHYLELCGKCTSSNVSITNEEPTSDAKKPTTVLIENIDGPFTN